MCSQHLGSLLSDIVLYVPSNFPKATSINSMAGQAHTPAVAVQGMVTLALSTWIPGLQPTHEGDTANWLQNLALYGSLYIVALGTGGIKPNVSAFGADQFDMSDAKVCCFSSRPVPSWQHALRICGLRLSPGSQDCLLRLSYSSFLEARQQQLAQLSCNSRCYHSRRYWI